MATYCIGDLHGRYDLFASLLNKINFQSDKDKLYVLGDVIDRSYGGIQILKYIMANQKSVSMIQGNHEDFFLFTASTYDLVFSSEEIRVAMVEAVDVYSPNLFEPISECFKALIEKRSAQSFYSASDINRWLNEGVPKVRSQLLSAMVTLVDKVDYDTTKYNKLFRILSNLQGHFKTKPFVQELLKQSNSEYEEIKHFLKSCPREYSLSLNGKNYFLGHSRLCANKNVSYKYLFPHAESSNMTYVYGHDPVPSMHRSIMEQDNWIDFDYYKVFAWIDPDNNRYYNLDLGSNPVVALKLDDMSEYYVGIPSTRKNATPWEVPEDTFPIRGESFLYSENMGIKGAKGVRSKLISFIDGCYEFMICLSPKRKQAYYTHIGWSEYRKPFLIEDFEVSDPAEVIRAVREGFMLQRTRPEIQEVDKILYGRFNQK